MPGFGDIFRSILRSKINEKTKSGGSRTAARDTSADVAEEDNATLEETRVQDALQRTPYDQLGTFRGQGRASFAPPPGFLDRFGLRFNPRRLPRR